mmetsp:Transcript_46253/g.92470  ORF Transcript_46253/g.92470 Transcript_46253/m.92470 type:complete len:221 (+) Transcript_46253:108-770(+)
MHKLRSESMQQQSRPRRCRRFKQSSLRSLHPSRARFRKRRARRTRSFGECESCAPTYKTLWGPVTRRWRTQAIALKTTSDISLPQNFSSISQCAFNTLTKTTAARWTEVRLWKRWLKWDSGPQIRNWTSFLPYLTRTGTSKSTWRSSTKWCVANSSLSHQAVSKPWMRSRKRARASLTVGPRRLPRPSSTPSASCLPTKQVDNRNKPGTDSRVSARRLNS